MKNKHLAAGGNMVLHRWRWHIQVYS